MGKGLIPLDFSYQFLKGCELVMLDGAIVSGKNTFSGIIQSLYL